MLLASNVWFHKRSYCLFLMSLTHTKLKLALTSINFNQILPYVCVIMCHVCVIMCRVCVCLCVCLVAQSCLTLCDPMDCCLPGSSVHGDSPGKNTGVGCHVLLQGIFPTQGSNPVLLHCRQIFYCLSLQGSCVIYRLS